MANKRGDKVVFRDFPGEWELTDVAEYPETIVRAENKAGKSVVTDASEIYWNFHEATREQAKAAGVSDELVDSLARGLVESAEGKVMHVGDFVQYLKADDLDKTV